MKSLVVVCLCVSLVACSSEDTNCPASLSACLPTPGGAGIENWQEDVDVNKPAGRQASSDVKEIAASWSFNGAIDVFTPPDSEGFVALGQEFYKNGDLRITLYLVQNDNQQHAQANFVGMEDYGGYSDWQTLSLDAGETQARIASIVLINQTYLRIDALKGSLFAEMEIHPMVPEAEDLCEPALKAFASAVMASLP